MPEENPLVSVLMTAYNREQYIREAIESVLSSTYTNFELIIVDDCSSDNTLLIAREYANRDSRLSVYSNPKNLGDYNNRNKAAGYVKGKYIKFVDSDDIIYPHSLSVFVTAMEMFSEAGVGIMSSANQDENPYPYLLQPNEAYHYHFYKMGIFDTGPTALIFRTDRFKEIGGFSGKRFVGDTEINMKLAAKWPVVKIASSLVYWRRHEGQEIIEGTKSTGYLELHLPMYLEAFSKAECPLSPEERERILSYYRKISAKEILKVALIKKKPAKAMSLYKSLKLELKDMFNAVMKGGKKY